MTSPARQTGIMFVIVALLGAPVGGQSAGRSSLSDSDIETVEARMTLEKVLAENARLKEEVQRLQEKLALNQPTAARMTESLALAASEAEVFRRQAGELKLRLEALGIESGSGGANKVEQRLLTAVNDLRHVEEERAKMREALAGLSEAALSFSKKATAADAEAKRALEQQMRRASEVLGDAAPGAAHANPAAATLDDGLVISISEELALVVANIGTKQGVATGMPFQVLRNDHVVGSIRVVEVREKIAGAIVEYLSSAKDPVKVGDRLKVAAMK